MPARQAPERLHLSHVEGLRALAALTVFVNHAYAQTWSTILDEYPVGSLSFLSYSLVAGHLAVSVFIVVSGFCLALPVAVTGDRLRNGPLAFIKRRAQRILPAYYGALALSLILIATIIGEPTGSLWDVPIQVTWVSIVSHVLLLQDLYATGSINYVFWSIAVEWHLYFFFPLLLLGFRRLGVLKTTVAALIVGYAFRFGFDGSRLARANPHFLGLFTLGMLGAYLVRSDRPELRRLREFSGFSGVAIAMLMTAFALMLTWGVQESTRRFHYLDLPVGLLAIAVLVHGSRRKGGRLERVLAAKPLVFIGTFSYSLYLLHAPLLQVIWQYVLRPLGVPKPMMFSILMTFGLGFVLVVSYAFFRVFEAPFLRKTGRLSAAHSVLQPPSVPLLQADLAAEEHRGA